MEKKEFWPGMLALALVFGMAVVGCDNGSGSKSVGGGKSITITGITGKTGDAVIYVVSAFDNANGMVAAGRGKVSSGSVTFNLIKEDMTSWTGSGSFYLVLIFDQDQSQYYYTNGQTINISEEDDFTKLPKYNITSATSTIAFNLFKELSSSISVPNAPTGLSAITKTDTTIAVSWDEVSGATGYHVYAGTSAGNLTLRGSPTVTSYLIQGLSPNVTYYIAVSAENEAGEGEESDSITVTTSQSVKPAAPSGLAAGVITEDSIAVSWNSVSDVSGYTVYAGTSSENMTQQGTPTTTSFTITGLTANTTYYIAVSAKNASGEGVQSSPITATTANIITRLPAPTGLTAAQSSSSSIQVLWNAVSGASLYKVYRSSSATGIYSSIGTTPGTSYNDVGVTPGDNYYYKVSALTSGNVEGDISDYVTGRIPTQTKAIETFGFVDFPLVNGTINGTNISVTVPNIVNLTTLVPTITHNGKSITPAADAAQNFTSPVEYTVTADDGTFQSYTVTVTVTNTALATAFSWINSIAKSGRTYTIVAQVNESLAPTTISSTYSDTNIILSGGTTEKTISLSSNGSLFTVDYGTLTLEKNITLEGRVNNNASLVMLNSSFGKLVMKDGSKIQNNTVATANNTDAYGGGVYINGGTFTMDGGTISGNKVQAGTSGSYSSTSIRAKGGGVYFYMGTFIMNGGTISSNTAYSAYYPSAGGGVYVDGSKIFIMNGGSISDNTAESSSVLATSYTYGGGVAAWDSSTFTMKGGTISGNSVKSADNRLGGGVYVKSDKFTKTGGTIYGSNASPTTLQNTAKNTDSGHAVYASVGSTTLKRNNTAGTTVNMDSSRTGSTGGWE
jgi:fibronectin type 3 domain-containing protein